MLVLSRKTGETVVVFNQETGDVIGTVMNVRASDGTVRLGFEFPRSVGIARSELIEIDAEESSEVRGDAAPNRTSSTNGSPRAARPCMVAQP